MEQFAPMPGMTMEEVQVQLIDLDLWSQFHERTTEMVITKGGRRMYPKLEFDVGGLNPNEEYMFSLFIDRADKMRYKFANGAWEPSANGEAIQPSQPIPPTEMGRALGSTWMKTPVSFAHVKLSNQIRDDPTVATVLSMHKYVPRLVVQRVERYSQMPVLVLSKTFRVAEFITVTAYQNTQLVSLKIAHNPYARGFKDGGHVTRKRRLLEMTDADELVLPKRRMLPKIEIAPLPGSSSVSPQPRVPSPEEYETTQYYMPQQYQQFDYGAMQAMPGMAMPPMQPPWMSSYPPYYPYMYPPTSMPCMQPVAPPPPPHRNFTAQTFVKQSPPPSPKDSYSTSPHSPTSPSGVTESHTDSLSDVSTE